MDQPLKNRIVWITGASSGIGEELAYACAEAGARLIISARREAELERVKTACPDPGAVLVCPFDLTNSSSIDGAFSEVSKEYGTPDLLIHCGGISQRSEAISTPAEVDRRIFEANFFSVVHLTKLVLPGMISRKSGRIVVITSLTGKWGFYLRSAYAASKHALHGFFDSLRMELEGSGIGITLVLPGFIATEISRHALDAQGQPTGEMDANQAGGMPPKECARRILKGVLEEREEFSVGGRETFGLTVHRWAPALFRKILKKQKPR